MSGRISGVGPVDGTFAFRTESVISAVLIAIVPATVIYIRGNRMIGHKKRPKRRF